MSRFAFMLMLAALIVGLMAAQGSAYGGLRIGVILGGPGWYAGYNAYGPTVIYGYPYSYNPYGYYYSPYPYYGNGYYRRYPRFRDRDDFLFRRHERFGDRDYFGGHRDRGFHRGW